MTQLTPTLLLLLFITTTSAIAGTPTTVTVPVPWFREKYLAQIYNEYYIYTFSRWRLDDNDLDMCPEIHKPAVYFAMTGRPLWRESPLSHPTYRQRQRRRRRQHIITQPTPYDIRLVEISVLDVVWFLIDFHLYCCELLILLLSILLASLTTIILCILVFGQY
jgi:hypothetical protein